MSNKSTNVAAVVDHAGTLYAYTTQDNGIVRYSRTAGGSGTKTTLSVSGSDITTQAGVGVALTPPSTATPAGQRILFWVTDAGGLVSWLDDGRSSYHGAGVNCSRNYNGIGVAALASGAMTAYFNGGNVNVVMWDWSSLLKGAPKSVVAKTYSASNLGISSYQAFNGDDGLSGSSVALAPFIDAEGVTHVFMVSTWYGTDKKFHVVGHVLDLTTTSSGTTVSCTNISHGNVALDVTGSKAANCPSVLQRPDGKLMVWFYNGSGVEQDLVTPTTGTSWYNDWTSVKGSGDVPVLDSYVYPCAIAFLPGNVSTRTSSVANSLTNATVDVYDAIFVQDDNDIDKSIDNNKWGTLRRTAQAPQAQQQIVALGVIYGPPPVPLDNINMPAEYSNTFTSGIVSFSQTTGTTSGMSANLGASLFGKVGGSAGYTNEISIAGFTIASISAKAQAELSLGTSLLGTWSSSTQQSVATTIQATVSLAGHAGSTSTQENQYSVQANGQIVGLSSTWASYVYDFVDANGNTPANALSFVAVFPYQPTLVLTPFQIPAGAEGPHPGDLSSYQLTAAQLNDLDSRARPVGGRDYLEVSWAVGGLSSQVAATYDQSDWSVTLGLDFGLMLGAEASADVMGVNGSLSGQVDLKANFGYTWSRGSTSSSQFSSSVSVPGNTSAHGSYSAYAYRAYLLAESKDNLSALPRGTTGAGSLTVSADSAPWLITYAVTSSTMV
jgi:hypothetical protein